MDEDQKQNTVNQTSTTQDQAADPESNSDTPAQQPLQEPHPDKKKQLMIVGLAVLLVLAAGLLWYFMRGDEPAQEETNQADTAASETDTTENTDTDTVEGEQENQDDTAEQETPQTVTYTNETYGFSFEYPSGEEWIIQSADGEVGDDENIVFIKYDCGPNCGLVFSMILDTEDPTTVQDWKDQFAQNSVYELSGEEEITLGSVFGTKLTFSPSGVEGIDDIVHVVANEIADTIQIVINSNGSTTESVDITDEGLKILESLKFN